jgi:fumarate reductase subunit C
LSAALIFVFSASVSCVVLWFAWFVISFTLGGTECDRGQCPAFGEWASEHGNAVLIILALLALLAGLLLTRRFLREGS